MRMRARLPWKLTAIFCSTLIAGLCLGYFYLTSHLKVFLEQDLQNTLKRQIELSRGFIDEQIHLTGRLSDPSSLARRIGSETGMRVTILSSDGEVLGDSGLGPDELRTVDNHAGRTEVQSALRLGFGLSRRYSNTLKKDLLYVAVPFGNSLTSGVLRFAMPMSDVRLFGEGLDRIVLVALVLVFLLSLAFTYLVSLIVSRPLREMSLLAKAMAAGDFSRVPLILSGDELGDLGDALANMSRQIRARINDIEEEKAKLDAVLSSMLEGVMLVDARGVVLLMNPALRKLFFVDIAPEGRRSVEIIRNSMVSGMLEKLLKGPDRFAERDVFVGFPEEKILKVNGVSIRSSGKPEGAVLVFHDITERRRLEKMRQDFVANVSHELRTPVASIKGYAETLLEGALDDPQHAREFAGIIRDNSDRLVSLINDLLDLAKIESGKLPMVFMPVDLKPVVLRCLGVLEKNISRKCIQILLEIPESSPKVRADEDRLAQVFLNLLDNAVKYTPDQGVITVRILPGEDLVRVEIADTGVGIPADDLPRIFERFYRVDKARSRDLGGTGLGLSIVKHIIHGHGGEVKVTSAPGKGATFSFTLSYA